MRHILISGVTVFGLCLGAAHAGVVLTVTNTGSTTQSATINLTTGPLTFNVDVLVDVSDTHILMTEANLVTSAPGIAEITAFSYNGTVWETSTAGSGGAINALIPNSSNPPAVPHVLPVAADLTTVAIAGRAHGRHGSIAKDLSAPGFTGVTGNCRLVTLTLQVLATAPPGTYTLNVTRIASGEYPSFINIGGTPGADFSLEILSGTTSPPVATAAVSRKTHGSVGSFDIDVFAGGAVECRSNGPTEVEVTFDTDIEGLGGLDNSDVNISSGTVTGVSISGDTLTVSLSGVTDGTMLNMSFPGIVGVGGDTAGTSTVCFGSLLGDITAEGATNIFDLIGIRNVLNAAVDATNFRQDVNADGGINIFDLIATRNGLNQTLSGSCP